METKDQLTTEDLIQALHNHAVLDFSENQHESVPFQAATKISELETEIKMYKEELRVKTNPFRQGNSERVSHKQYSEAVIKLMEVAQHNTGGGHAAAQVLLGLYNSDAFHVDLVDVACRFDATNRQAAITAIIGRGQLMKEPHTAIQDGDKHFSSLWQQWQSLHVEKRYSRYYGGE